MRETAGDGISHGAFRTTLSAPRVRFHDTTLDHCAIRLDSLPRGLKAELIKTAESRKAGRSEGSVEHVEVFRTVSMRTSILEDLDTYHRSTRGKPHTLNCEEPENISTHYLVR